MLKGKHFDKLNNDWVKDKSNYLGILGIYIESIISTYPWWLLQKVRSYTLEFEQDLLNFVNSALHFFFSTGSSEDLFTITVIIYLYHPFGAGPLD